MSCPEPERLVELAEGRLGDVELHALESHIDICEDCREGLAAIISGGSGAAWTLGRYRIDGVLGSGGMGIVYRGWDPALSRPVAVKVVRTGDDDGALRSRLAREAQSLARLNHLNVCHVYDVGTDGPELWIAMELVEGVTLRTWLAGTPARDAVLAVLLAAGHGLAAAHAAGMIHRDVKPENVLVDRTGRAVVTDFGLARVDDGDRATKTSILAGTPAYMAPEQLDAAPASARSDQYAFAVMAHEALTGARPRPRNVVNPALPPALRAALTRALADEPNERFASIPDLLAALAVRPPRRRWPAVMGIAGVTAIGVAVVALAIPRDGSGDGDGSSGGEAHPLVAHDAPPDAAITHEAPPDAPADAGVAIAHRAPADAATAIAHRAPVDAGVAIAHRPPADAGTAIAQRAPHDAGSPDAAFVADADAPRLGVSRNVKNIRPNRITTLAEAEKEFASGYCQLPGMPKANTWTQAVDWGKVVRVADAVVLESGDPKGNHWSPMDARLYEIQGQHRRYTIDGYIGGALHGELGARPGDMVALCPQRDDDGWKLPEGWSGPVTWVRIAVRVGGPPDYQHVPVIDYPQINETAHDQSWPHAKRALVYDGTGGKLANGRFMMSGWQLEIDASTKNAFDPHRGAWIVVEDPRWEPYVKDRSITVLHAAEMRRSVFPEP